MQLFNVLPEVISSRPSFVLFRAVRDCTDVVLASHYIVLTATMTIQIIPSSKSFIPGTARYAACKRFIVAKLVFPSTCQSHQIGSDGRQVTYFRSDLLLKDISQFEHANVSTTISVVGALKER